MDEIQFDTRESWKLFCKNHSTPTVSLDFYKTISIPLSCLIEFLHNSSLEPTGSRELLFPQYHFSRLIAVQLVIQYTHSKEKFYIILFTPLHLIYLHQLYSRIALANFYHFSHCKMSLTLTLKCIVFLQLFVETTIPWKKPLTPLNPSVLTLSNNS